MGVFVIDGWGRAASGRRRWRAPRESGHVRKSKECPLRVLELFPNKSDLVTLREPESGGPLPAERSTDGREALESERVVAHPAFEGPRPLAERGPGGAIPYKSRIRLPERCPFKERLAVPDELLASVTHRRGGETARKSRWEADVDEGSTDPYLAVPVGGVVALSADLEKTFAFEHAGCSANGTALR